MAFPTFLTTLKLNLVSTATIPTPESFCCTAPVSFPSPNASTVKYQATITGYYESEWIIPFKHAEDTVEYNGTPLRLSFETYLKTEGQDKLISSGQFPVAATYLHQTPHFTEQFDLQLVQSLPTVQLQFKYKLLARYHWLVVTLILS